MIDYIKRLLLALDELVQACFHYGVPGVTISARSATAQIRGHRWGCWLCDFLNSRLGALLGFGPNPDGTSHCAGAIVHDRERARAVLTELDGY